MERKRFLPLDDAGLFLEGCCGGSTEKGGGGCEECKLHDCAARMKCGLLYKGVVEYVVSSWGSVFREWLARPAKALMLCEQKTKGVKDIRSKRSEEPPGMSERVRAGARERKKSKANGNEGV